MNTNFHTVSRMRENCTYGSMRGRAFPTGCPALLYTLVVLERYGEGIIGNVHQGQGESMSSLELIVLKNHVYLFNRQFSSWDDSVL